MKLPIIDIGNSRGIRIPKAFLEQCHIKTVVDLETKGDNIIIRPLGKEVRKGWEQAFKRMRALKDDCLLIDDCLDLDGSWEWK